MNKPNKQLLKKSISADMRPGTHFPNKYANYDSFPRNRSAEFHEKQRHTMDLDAHQAKKSQNWYFGFKAHIGVDKDNGLSGRVASPRMFHRYIS